MQTLGYRVKYSPEYVISKNTEVQCTLIILYSKNKLYNAKTAIRSFVPSDGIHINFVEMFRLHFAAQRCINRVELPIMFPVTIAHYN